MYFNKDQRNPRQKRIPIILLKESHPQDEFGYPQYVFCMDKPPLRKFIRMATNTNLHQSNSTEEWLARLGISLQEFNFDSQARESRLDIWSIKQI